MNLIGDEPAKPEEFLRILEAGFEELQVGTIPQEVDRVVAGDMERTRLKQVKALFFAGVNDGNIPRNSGKGGIISDLEREFLTGSGQELAPSPRQQMYIQRLYLYLNMTKPSCELVLSWARMDQTGKALRPSFLIGHMQRLFPGLAPERPEMDGKLCAVPVFARWTGISRRRDSGNLPNRLLDKEQEKEFLTLYQIYQKDELYGVWTGKLTDTAFFAYQEPSLKKAVAAALYGQTLSGSVSRLEQFAACAYAHFLKYGMKLKEQEEFSFEADGPVGNIFHRRAGDFCG